MGGERGNEEGKGEEVFGQRESGRWGGKGKKGRKRSKGKKRGVWKVIRWGSFNYATVREHLAREHM